MILSATLHDMIFSAILNVLLLYITNKLKSYLKSYVENTITR